MVHDMLKLGPKEMKGEIWDQKNKSDIVQISISHQNNCINSFQITIACADEESMGDVYAQKRYGNPDGTMNYSTVTIDHPSEFIVSVSGAYLNGKLASIAFATNKRRHGPFGKTGGSSNNSAYEPFNFDLGPKNLFGGFHGSVYNGFVYAIGVYVKPYELIDRYQEYFYDILSNNCNIAPADTVRDFMGVQESPKIVVGNPSVAKTKPVKQEKSSKKKRRVVVSE